MFTLPASVARRFYVDPASRLVMVCAAVRKQARDPGVREANALWWGLVQQLGH